MKSTKNNWWKLVVSLLLSLSAGFFGSFFTTPNIASWYAFLNKPFFSPPNWLFGPVWTLLFILMGISFYLVWRKNERGSGWALLFFIFHLAINILWSAVFFGSRNPGGAVIVIGVLWLMIISLMFWFWRFNKIASWLLLPYLLWVSFASILNIAVWQLNK